MIFFCELFIKLYITFPTKMVSIHYSRKSGEACQLTSLSSPSLDFFPSSAMFSLENGQFPQHWQKPTLYVFDKRIMKGFKFLGICYSKHDQTLAYYVRFAVQRLFVLVGRERFFLI